MRNTFAIAAKETRVYLTTWMSYILFASFLLITAYFFQAMVLQFQLLSQQYMQMQAAWAMEQMNLNDMVMSPLLMNITVFFVFLIPILTMRLVSEERKGKTLELLLTSPVRPIEIVLGKYLAGLLMMTLMLALTLVFPALLELFGRAGGAASPLDWNTVWTGYLGLFLVGAAFVAIGLFTSSTTESQVVAVVTGFFIVMMFFVIGFAAQGREGFWKEFFEYLWLTGHLESFTRGVVKSTGIVYYVSLATLGLFLTWRVIEAQRWR